MTAEKITNTWRSELYNLSILSGRKTRHPAGNVIDFDFIT